MLMEPSRRFAFAFSLVMLVMAPSILSAHATNYPVKVLPGDWAEYKPLYRICTVPGMFCQSSGNDILSTKYAAIHVIDVSGDNVTLSLITVDNTGTGFKEGALVNVSTGFSNVTILPGLTSAPSDYLVLAGGLQVNDTIWNSATAPKLNRTDVKTVLGMSRSVNFLNFTYAYPIYNGYSASIHMGFAFDQASGILIEASFSISSSAGPAGSFQDSFALGMADNNIWLSSVPDFFMSYSAPISFQAGSSGTTTIMIIPQHGFASLVHLTVLSPSGLSCMPSKSSLPGYGTFTLTCRGDPGNYQANVTATTDSTSHSTLVPVSVSNAPAPNQPSANSWIPLFVTVGIVGVIALLAVYLILRRKYFRSVPSGAANSSPST